MRLDSVHTDLELHKPENKSTSWIRGTGAWITYVLAIIVFRLFLSAFFLSPVVAWTTWNVSHAVVTFFLFHWLKGVTFTDEETHDGKYDKLTLWEQIDSGVQYTPTRKFLTIIPVILYLLTSHYTKDHTFSLLLNTIAFVVVLIAKQPFMNKMRLFGINSQ